MGAVLRSLVREALREIERREPHYLARFPLAVPPAGDRGSHRYRRHPLLQDCPPQRIGEALAEAIDWIAVQGARIVESDDVDPVATLLLDSAADGLAAELGRVDLQTCSEEPQSVSEVLERDYRQHRTAAGRRYYVRRRGSRPLLLVNALGIPIGMWARLLGDTGHDYRIILAESRCGDLLAGGMETDAGLACHADDLAAVLDAEGVACCDVVAWCNGGRIAVALADRQGPRIRSLVLLATTMRGIAEVPPQPSPFEDNLQQVFASVAAANALARPLVGMLSRFSRVPEWDHLNDAETRAAALFRMPAREEVGALLTPMSRPEFLIAYGRRTAADEAWPLAEALARLRAPVLLVTGDHDNVVNSAFVRAAVSHWVRGVVHATVHGAGHYVHDLQYVYFRWLLRCFLDQGTAPPSLARVAVEVLP